MNEFQRAQLQLTAAADQYDAAIDATIVLSAAAADAAQRLARACEATVYALEEVHDYQAMRAHGQIMGRALCPWGWM